MLIDFAYSIKHGVQTGLDQVKVNDRVFDKSLDVHEGSYLGSKVLKSESCLLENDSSAKTVERQKDKFL